MYHGKYESNVRGKAAAAPKAARTAKEAPRRTPVSKKKTKKRTTAGTVIFYTLYFLGIAAACLGIFYGLNWLTGWLEDYEASQPDAKCQQVFDRYFADPDWLEVYTLLDSQSVGTMTAEAFAEYMDATVGTRELTYVKTSAGLSGGRKYILRLDGENLGIFTLQNAVTGELDIPDWQLDSVEIFFSAQESVTVYTAADNTVTVNGQPLDESHIIISTSTVAEDYLPEGIHGPRTVTYALSGLLNAPEVTVTDPEGNPVSMDFDPQTGVYSQPLETISGQITQEEYDFILDGTKAYFRFMLDAAGTDTLRRYFDSSSDTYTTIVKSEDPWLQNYRTYSFGQENIYNFCRYNADMFSVRIAMDLNVTRTNGTIKTFSVETTYFVSTGSSNKIIAMTNVDVLEVLTQVRMTYLLDGQVVHSEMVADDVSTLTTPTVEAPEGKQFSGWFLQSTNEKGDTTYTRAFLPEADGTVALPAGYTLEPMELHAIFGKDE